MSDAGNPAPHSEHFSDFATNQVSHAAANVLLTLSNWGGIFDSEVKLARWANGILADARCREQVEDCCGNLWRSHLEKDGWRLRQVEKAFDHPDYIFSPTAHSSSAWPEQFTLV
jgi:hypothetical protein